MLGHARALAVASAVVFGVAGRAAAAPSVDSFTATASGNIITLSWATSGGQCGSGLCLIYIFGPGRFNASGISGGDIGFQGATGSMSFRVPSGGVYTYIVQVVNGLQVKTATRSVDVAAPAVPQPTVNPVYVDLLKARVAAPTDVVATLSWTHPGSGYVLVQLPGQGFGAQ